jgi:NADPH:quinone reductase-like Zn-dependent oxidoreductase
VLIAVRAAALNPKDVLTRKGKYRWLSGTGFPRGTGLDWAGEVLAIGPEVTQARIGDAVYGMANGWAGGTVAERFVALERECAPMPLGLTFEEAASLPLAGQTALQALRDLGEVRTGSQVLILGASGGVGVHGVQIARALGARVTASASAANLPRLRDLGATEVIDYRAEDPLDGGPYDLVFDAFGNRRFMDAQPALAERATFVTTIPSARIVLERLRTFASDQRARLVVVHSRREDLLALGRLVEAGLVRPVLDSVYPLDRIAQGHARLETRRVSGKVIIRIADPPFG